MKKQKLAPRPFTLNLLGNADTNDADRYTITLDANNVDFYELGGAVGQAGSCEVLFYKWDLSLVENKRLVGTLWYDAIDYGMHIQQIVGDALYEARHPWLDLKDGMKKGVMQEVMEYVVHKKAFKPLHPLDFYKFEHVKVWKGK